MTKQDIPMKIVNKLRIHYLVLGIIIFIYLLLFSKLYMKSSDAKASKCHLKFFVYVQLFHFNDNQKNLYLRKMLILEENFRWHLEAFASELFIYRPI